MKDQLITFETAKLAKEKGFDLEVEFMTINERPELVFSARDDGDTDYNWNEREGYSLPTQSLLQKWLREKHNKFVFVTHRKFGVSSCNGWYYHIGESIEYGLCPERYNTYETALEAGLQEVLREV